MSANPTVMAELHKEADAGGMGEEVAREIPRIDMADFTARKSEIADQVWQAF